MNKITEFERLSLYNQYTLLADVAQLREDNDAEKQYRSTAEIFRNGYSAEYDREDNTLLGFYKDEDVITDEEQEEVGLLLSMYSYLSNHYDSSKKKFPDLAEIKYVGYDDNDTSGNRKNSYLNFILNDKGLYEQVKKAFSENSSGTNSHGNSSPRISMLNKYLELHKNEDFYGDSDNYVKEIIEAE